MTSPSFQVHDPVFRDLVDILTLPQAIATGFAWAEGPVWWHEALYFNDIPAKQMWKWQADAGLSVALDNSEFANGNTLDNEGRMVSCEHGGRRVIRRADPANPGAVSVIVDRYRGNRLNSPNDVVVRSDGSIWFTDPPYGINSDIEGYPAESEVGGCHVYCVQPDGTLIAVTTDFDKPNGLAFSPDERRLYIADSGAIRGASFPGIDDTLPHHIRVFDVDGTTLRGGQVFAVIEPGVPDGLRVDQDGNVWTSAMDGIHCLSPEGRCLGKILLPAPTANLCFGGPDGTDMFITASDTVWQVRTTRKDAATCLRNKEART